MTAYTTYNDENLVRLLSGHGDKEAFTELYRRYWEKLLIQAVTKLKSEEEAKEVLQDVFLNLWRRRKELKIRHSFHTYIASCVKYEIIEKLVSQKKRNYNESQAGSLLPNHDNHIANYIDFEETRLKLESTIRALPEKCQLVFRLSRENGFSEKQIAEKLDISTKTVEAHITKALKTLRTSLQQFLLCLL